AGRDAAQAEELLGLSLTGVAPANIAAALPGIVARSSPFGELAYRYTLAHWKALATLAGSWNQLRLLPNAAAGFNEADRAQQLIDDQRREAGDRKSTRLNSSHLGISYAVFCLKKKKTKDNQ